MQAASLNSICKQYGNTSSETFHFKHTSVVKSQSEGQRCSRILLDGAKTATQRRLMTDSRRGGDDDGRGGDGDMHVGGGQGAGEA